MRYSAGCEVGTRRPVGLAALVVCLAFAAAPAPAAARQQVPNGYRAGSQSQIKTPIVGLIDKGSERSYHQGVPFGTADPSEIAPDASAISGVVVNESWAQLESTRGHYTFSALTTSSTRSRPDTTAIR
jgi:hypothetical protein